MTCWLEGADRVSLVCRIVSIPGKAAGFFLMDYCGRRTTLVGCLLLSGVGCFVSAYARQGWSIFSCTSNVQVNWHQKWQIKAAIHNQTALLVEC